MANHADWRGNLDPDLGFPYPSTTKAPDPGLW